MRKFIVVLIGISIFVLTPQPAQGQKWLEAIGKGIESIDKVLSGQGAKQRQSNKKSNNSSEQPKSQAKTAQGQNWLEYIRKGKELSYQSMQRLGGMLGETLAQITYQYRASKAKESLQVPKVDVSVLDNLSFESYNKYVMLKDIRSTGNLRKTPSKNGRIITDGSLTGMVLCPVFNESGNWYKVRSIDRGWRNGDKTGWVSKTIVNVSSKNPIQPSMMNSMQAGFMWDMDDFIFYRVFSPVGSHGLAVAVVADGGWITLRLGKLIDNVFVFKYAINISPEKNSAVPNKFTYYREKQDGRLIYNLGIGEDFYTLKMNKPYYWDKNNNQAWEYTEFDLSRLNDKLLAFFFADVIKNKVFSYMYIDADMLSGDYVDFYI